MSGWIKIHRKIDNWEWYTDANTFRVFFHLVLTANRTTKNWRGITIPTGSIFTSYDSIGSGLGLSKKQVRLAVSKLKQTGEIEVGRHANGMLISVVKWGSYQLNEEEQGHPDGQTEGRLRADQGHQLKKERSKRSKEVNIYNGWSPDFNDPDFIKAWEANRKAKKMAVSQSVIDLMAKKFAKGVQAGYTPSDIKDAIIERSWGSFEVKWLDNSQQRQKNGPSNNEDILSKFRESQTRGVNDAI